LSRKAAGQRLRDIAHAWLLLAEDGAAGAPVLPRRGLARAVWHAAAIVAAAALGAVSWVHFRETAPAATVPLHFQISPPSDAPGSLALLNISPDGRKLAFLAGGRLWVHFLESGETRNLTEANGTPFWSPDSRFIGYAIASNKLMRIEATGVVPRTLAEFRGFWGGAAWNQDDVIVFSDLQAIFRVPGAGGVPIKLTALDPARQDALEYSPQFLPDGRHLIYTRRSLDERNCAVLIGSVDEKPESQSSKVLVRLYLCIIMLDDMHRVNRNYAETLRRDA
jgi:hypothetical protein